MFSLFYTTYPINNRNSLEHKFFIPRCLAAVNVSDWSLGLPWLWWSAVCLMISISWCLPQSGCGIGSTGPASVIIASLSPGEPKPYLAVHNEAGPELCDKPALFYDFFLCIWLFNWRSLLYGNNHSKTLRNLPKTQNKNKYSNLLKNTNRNERDTQLIRWRDWSEFIVQLTSENYCSDTKP